MNELNLPERYGYRLKRLALGPPLVTANLHAEKLTNKAALGVLSSDCISSSAYGSEEMLIVLLPVFGLAGFHLLMPITAVVLGLLVLMTLSYREVVAIYTQAGGSYVVARENFGPRIAQVASVALLIDYVVTVAVQTAAGAAAITSLVPPLRPLTTEITIAAVLVLAYGNLRGVREAGRVFALPTYLFAAAAGAVVVAGVLREILGDLPRIGYSAHERALLIDVHSTHGTLLSAGAIYVLLKAFANGGASLTGLEAISNGVSAFRAPAGPNARRTLSRMSVILGSLVLGVSFLAWQTHATPYASGSPTVISQVARAAFGAAWYGQVGFVVVQIATALILFTGANTPFTGFPFLASFVAEDSFLPRQLTRRGHRLAFSNGIVVLTVAALALLLCVGAHVDSLIPFYAIGVFTGFAMAGLGMARYHQRTREPRWRTRLAINVSAGLVSACVVVIFAVVKFTEGAWLVVVLFPVGWLALLRLNRRYRDESRALDLASWIRPDQAEAPGYARHTVLVFVDRLDLAVLRAFRYAASLRPTSIRAVHVMLDAAAATQLQRDWIARGLGDRLPLAVVHCPDRRLVRAAATLAMDAVVTDRSEVTVLLPRRTFRPLSRRLLHDRTADRIAESVSRLPHVAATIVPFDTTLPHAAVERLEALQASAAHDPALARVGRASAPSLGPAVRAGDAAARACDPAPNGCSPISAVAWRQRVTVQGQVELVQAGTAGGRSLEVHLYDETGGLRLLFYGRTAIAGLVPGARVRASGRVGEFKGHLALANPRYELLAAPEP